MVWHLGVRCLLADTFRFRGVWEVRPEIMTGISQSGTLVLGMKISVGHWPKSVHIARLTIHFTLQSVIMAGREMRMLLQWLNYHHVKKKSAEKSKLLQVLANERQLWDQARAAPWKWSSWKVKCHRRCSTSEMDDQDKSLVSMLWCVVCWLYKTRNFSRAWIDGSSNHKTSNITDHTNSEPHKGGISKPFLYYRSEDWRPER